MNGDLKQTFILKYVQDYLNQVHEAMAVLIVRKKAIDTEALLKSLADKVRSQGPGVTGELLFKEYGRFLDMGVGRGHPLGGLKGVRVSLQSRNKTGIAQVKDNIIKPKKIYASVAYGKLNYLQNKLLYGFTEEAIASLKTMETNGGSN